MSEPFQLRDQTTPSLLVIVRLGANTLGDELLERSVTECHGRRAIWGFCVLEVPDGDFERLARLRPIVTQRRLFLIADGQEVVAAGFPLLPTLDYPHWTLQLSEPSAEQFGRVRALFRGPQPNPTWAGPERRLR